MDEIDEWGGKRLHASLRLTSCLTFHIDNDDNANLHVWGACGRSGNQDSYRPTYM
jgi:hypothetical protein